MSETRFDGPAWPGGRDSRSFILRLWRDSGGTERGQWRGQVQPVPGEEPVHFARLEQLHEVMAHLLGEPSGSGRKG